MASFLTDPFVAILQHREILSRTTITEARRKYAGSLIGASWMVASPLILMALYALIYLAVFRVQPPTMSQTDYVLYIFCGLIPFLGFMEALNTGASSLSLNKAVLLNTVFPAELVPVRAVLIAQGSTAIGLLLLLALALTLGKWSASLLLVPLVWLFLVLFVTGIVWILSLASLVLRDIQQILAFLSIVLLIVSPIAYTLDMAPGPMKMVIYGNPLSYYLMAIQEAVVLGRTPAMGILSAVVLLGLSSFGIGYWVFRRAKRVFLDYV